MTENRFVRAAATSVCRSRFLSRVRANDAEEARRRSMLFLVVPMQSSLARAIHCQTQLSRPRVRAGPNRGNFGEQKGCFTQYLTCTTMVIV